MDAVTYFKEKKRLTGGCEEGFTCIKCRLSLTNSGTDMACSNTEAYYPEKAVAIIEQWALDYPEETYRTQFLKNYPKAYADCGGFPCINLIYGKGTGKCQGVPTCAKCWDSPYKEENE